MEKEKRPAGQVTLTNWYFIIRGQPGASPQNIDVFVEGVPYPVSGMSYVRSAKIISRMNSNGSSLKSSGQKIYILKSPMNRIMSKIYGYPDSLLSQFQNGFPENWRELLMDFYVKKSKTGFISEAEKLQMDLKKMSFKYGGKEVIESIGFLAWTKRNNESFLEICKPPPLQNTSTPISRINQATESHKRGGLSQVGRKIPSVPKFPWDVCTNLEMSASENTVPSRKENTEENPKNKQVKETAADTSVSVPKCRGIDKSAKPKAVVRPSRNLEKNLTTALSSSKNATENQHLQRSKYGRLVKPLLKSSMGQRIVYNRMGEAIYVESGNMSSIKQQQNMVDLTLLADELRVELVGTPESPAKRTRSRSPVKSTTCHEFPVQRMNMIQTSKGAQKSKKMRTESRNMAKEGSTDKTAAGKVANPLKKPRSWTKEEAEIFRWKYAKSKPETLKEWEKLCLNFKKKSVYQCQYFAKKFLNTDLDVNEKANLNPASEPTAEQPKNGSDKPTKIKPGTLKSKILVNEALNQIARHTNQEADDFFVETPGVGVNRFQQIDFSMDNFSCATSPCSLAGRSRLLTASMSASSVQSADDATLNNTEHGFVPIVKNPVQYVHQIQKAKPKHQVRKNANRNSGASKVTAKNNPLLNQCNVQRVNRLFQERDKHFTKTKFKRKRARIESDNDEDSSEDENRASDHDGILSDSS